MQVYRVHVYISWLVILLRISSVSNKKHRKKDVLFTAIDTCEVEG